MSTMSELFMCHKQEMMQQFHSQVGRSHRSLNVHQRRPSIPSEILPPDDVIIPYNDVIIDEGTATHPYTDDREIRTFIL